MACFRLETNTAALWASKNPRLHLGQVGVEVDPDTGEFGKAKLGDGSRRWNDLDYWDPADAVAGWTVVESSAASVSPTAADSGTYYRLSHISATFNLPTTGLVVGSTEFWVTFTGQNDPHGTIDAGEGSTFDHTAYEDGNGFSGATGSPLGNFVPYSLIHLKYVAATVWASNGAMRIV